MYNNSMYEMYLKHIHTPINCICPFPTKLHTRSAVSGKHHGVNAIHADGSKHEHAHSTDEVSMAICVSHVCWVRLM